MRAPRAVFAAAFICWISAAWLMPLVQDEAYYFAWAQHLAFGYFDHPPIVALIGWAATFAHGSPLIARLGTLATAAMTFAATARLFRILGLRTPTAQATALLLAFGNIMGLILGVITTPDTGLMLAWTIALSEAALALQGAHRRWLSAGLATGLGFLAKYMMVLIGPVFLWALIAEARRVPRQAALRSPWPYLGALVALVVILPHLAWNADNDWITMRFQLRHGFISSHMNLPRSDVLPWPEQAKIGSREWELAEVFKGPPEALKKPRVATVFDPYLNALSRCLTFFGSQLAFWGALAGVILQTWWERWRLRRRGASGTLAGPAQPMAIAPALSSALTPASRPLVVASVAVPLAFFAALSLATGVEANWSAMYLFGAAALLAPLLQRKGRALWLAFAINATLLALIICHAHTGLLPIHPKRDRILSESHGYKELGSYVARLKGPLFTDSYQLTAMVRFYSDGRQVAQWPRMTRDSEFVRQPNPVFTTADLHAEAAFWLLTSSPPPHFIGFRAVDMTQLRDCKDAGLQVISTTAAREVYSPCSQPIHAWFLVRYETETSYE